MTDEPTDWHERGFRGYMLRFTTLLFALGFVVMILMELRGVTPNGTPIDSVAGLWGIARACSALALAFLVLYALRASRRGLATSMVLMAATFSAFTMLAIVAGT